MAVLQNTLNLKPTPSPIWPRAHIKSSRGTSRNPDKRKSEGAKSINKVGCNIAGPADKAKLALGARESGHYLQRVTLFTIRIRIIVSEPFQKPPLGSEKPPLPPSTPLDSETVHLITRWIIQINYRLMERSRAFIRFEIVPYSFPGNKI